MRKSKLVMSFMLMLMISAFSISAASADSTSVDINSGAPFITADSITAVENSEVNSELVFSPMSEPLSYYPGTTTSIKSGDVLVTNSTSFGGIAGHAGIVVDPAGSVVSINGPGQLISRETFGQWKNRYANTKVMRNTSSSIAAQNAANWANEYYIDYSYRVSYNILGILGEYTDRTYCSKIVWNAYFYGANVNLANQFQYQTYTFYPYYLINNSGLTQVAAIGAAF